MKEGKLNHWIRFGPRIPDVLCDICLTGMTVESVFSELGTLNGGSGIPRQESAPNGQNKVDVSSVMENRSWL